MFLKNTNIVFEINLRVLLSPWTGGVRKHRQEETQNGKEECSKRRPKLGILILA